jgi:alpha-glucuronidase
VTTPKRVRLLLASGLLLVSAATRLYAENGHELWLRYRLVANAVRLAEYRGAVTHIVVNGESPTLTVVRGELKTALRGLLGTDIPLTDQIERHGAVLAGTPAGSPIIAALGLANDLGDVGAEGFIIRTASSGGKRIIVIAANQDIGVLYGAFAFLKQLQTERELRALRIASAPRIQLRLLNHWDNLDGTVERGYAGFSLWDWHKLPDFTAPRYTDYARANAAIGINGTVLTNVNANAIVLTPEYLAKVAALAAVFRPYGIKVYLTARFSAPMEIGGLKTADPLEPTVRAWWRRKVAEIYTFVPDFGGFLVKANSEGQPGPQDYGRSHAEGANLLADALAPHGGVVMWRAFVYSNEVPVDRIRQAYDEFNPLDGSFRDNVFVQVKNGALDFQPREPFHPLFGGMPKTPLMMEFQITKEYLGLATSLVYLAPLWKEVLDADTYARGPGSSVAKVIDGSLAGHTRSGIAGVANTGTDRNWSGSTFAQANWYAYGRLAWDHTLSAGDIADEWIRMTLSNDVAFIEPVKSMLLVSREAAVNYMTPLGLAHLMARGHHYGPGPWVEGGPRADWTSVYYHRADTIGIGFDRTVSGSNAVSQYFPPLRARFASRDSVGDQYLLWFHRVRWDERMRSGRTLWEELVHRYYLGVDTVRSMQKTWASLRGTIDDERYRETEIFLAIQEKEARWWRDASVLYFQTFSREPIPSGYERPAHPLSYYVNLVSPYVPGS